MKKTEKGFSLVEILVVLTILGITAMIAVGLSDTDQDQECFEQTETLLKQIKEAILGQPATCRCGTRWFSGYVADMGELPELLGERMQPVGLWTNQLDAYGKENLPEWNRDDSGSRIWAGWNGPYIRLRTDTLRDGWDHLIVFRDYTTHPQDVAEGDMVIKSLGANGIEDDTDTGFDQDVQIIVRHNEYAGTVAGRAAGDVTAIMIFYPEKGVIQQSRIELPDPNSRYFRFEKTAGNGKDIPFGIRSIRVAGAGGSIYIFAAEPTVNWVGTIK